MMGITFLLGLGILLLAAGAILLAINHCLQGDGQRRRCWRWRRGAVAAETSPPKSPLRGPWRCIPNCTDCVKATEEMQQLLLLVGAQTSTSAMPDAKLWQAAWQDLAQRLERGYLPCCDCSSSSFPDSFSGSENLRDTCMSQDGEPLGEMSSPFSGSTCVQRARSAPRMHMARKTPELWLGALPMPVQCSSERVVQWQGHHVLPELILPEQRQPLLQHKPSPWAQLKADTTVNSIKGKEIRRLLEDPNTTEESLNLLTSSCQPLPAPGDMQLPKGHSLWGTRALGQDTAVGLPGEGQQEPQRWHYSEEMTKTQPPPPALPSLGSRAAGPGTILASIWPRGDVIPQGSSATQVGCQDNTEHGSWSHAAAPIISRLVRSQELCNILSMLVERKYLDIKHQRLPVVVQRSIEMMHQNLPTLGWAGAGPLGPCSAAPALLQPNHVLQPDQDTLQQPGASLPCPVASTAPCTSLHREEGGQASLQASSLPSTSFSCHHEHWGCSKAEAITASRCFGDLTSAVPSETTSCRLPPEEGPRAHKPPGARSGCWSSGRQSPCSSESSCGWGTWSQVTSQRTVISRSTDTMETLTSVGLPEANPTQESVPTLTMAPSSPEGTPRQHSLSLQQYCRDLPTGHEFCCHLHPVQEDQGSGTTLRSLLEKTMCQRRRNLSPSLQSSSS